MATAATKISPAILKMASIAKAAGMPKDQLERFVSLGYVPQPKQMLFSAACRSADEKGGPLHIGYGGARGGGKTHCAFSQVAKDDCQRFPDSKWLFLRKIGKYAKESLEDLRRNLLQGVAHEHKNNIFYFPNDSRIVSGAYQYEKDIDNYLSLEYDGILIEQAEQLTGKKIDTIATVCRTSKQGWRPRMYYTFNPGGVGHSYLKKRFIQPWRDERESDTRFIFATYRDNAFINEEYKQMLDNLTGWLRAAWRDGDWDIMAGQFFSTFRYDAHTIEAAALPNPIPDNWRVWCAMDYGFTHPTVVYLFGEIDGTVFVIDEYCEQKQTVSTNAARIKAMLARHGVTLSRLDNFVAGADVFAKRGDNSGKTIADQYADDGIFLRAANSDRINGAANLLRMLGDVDRGIQPTLKISRVCHRLIECLPVMEHDPNRPEDVLKVDADEDGTGGDDPYDAVRYGCNVSNSVGIFL